MRIGIIIATIIIGIVLLGNFFYQHTDDKNAQTNTLQPRKPSIEAEKPVEHTKHIIAREITMLPAYTSLSFNIPSEWEVSYVPAVEAINIFDPKAAETGNLEKSQIFIRYFRANEFLTLSTVTIISRTTGILKDKSMIDYTIQKKPNVPNFNNQPSWRNEEHRAVDVRASDKNPSFFYSFAKRPSVVDEVFENFLNSVSIEN